MNENSMYGGIESSESNINSSLGTSNTSGDNSMLSDNNSFQFNTKKKKENKVQPKNKIQNIIICKKTNEKFIPHSEEIIKHFQTCEECKLSQFYNDTIQEEQIKEIHKKKKKVVKKKKTKFK